MDRDTRSEELDRGMDDDFHFVENEDVKSCGTCSVTDGGENEDEQILSLARKDFDEQSEFGKAQDEDVTSQASMEAQVSLPNDVEEGKEEVVLLKRQVTVPEEEEDDVKSQVGEVIDNDEKDTCKEVSIDGKDSQNCQGQLDNVEDTAASDFLENNNVSSTAVLEVQSDADVKEPSSNNDVMENEAQHSPTIEQECCQKDQDSESKVFPSAPSSISPSQFYVRDPDYDEEDDSQVDWDSVSQCVSNFVAATIPDNMLAVEHLIERMSELGKALHSSDGHRSVIDEIISMGGQVDEDSANATATADDKEDSQKPSNLSDLDLVYKTLEKRHVVQALQTFLNMPVTGDILVDFAKHRVKSIQSLGLLSVPHLCDLLPALAKLLNDAPELAALSPVLIRFVSELSDLLDNCSKRTDMGDAKHGVSFPPKVTKSSTIQEPKTSNVEPVEHRHVLCDGCSPSEGTGKYITGIRWKSAVREDFDLCSTCEASGDYEEEYGPFLKITSPKKAPREIVVVLKDQQAQSASSMGKFGRKSRDAQPKRNESQSRGIFCGGPGRVPLQFHKRGDRLFNHTSSRSRCYTSRKVAATQNDQQKQQLLCPNNHKLHQFQATGGYTCDKCSCSMRFGSILHGCRTCDYDMCQSCSTMVLNSAVSSEKAKVPPVKVHETNEVHSGAQSSSKAASFPVDHAPQHQQIERPRAKFVADMSLPDGSIVSPKAKLVKTWRISNPGNQTWPSGVRLVTVGGDTMQAKNGLAIPSLAPGAQHDIELDIVAPEKPGRYVGYWRLMTSGAEQMRFGHRLWVDLNVEAGVAPNEPDVVLSELDRLDRFADQLARLSEMGFTDQEQNLNALDESHGHVEDAIAKLLA